MKKDQFIRFFAAFAFLSVGAAHAQFGATKTPVNCSPAHLAARETKLGIPSGTLVKLARKSVVSIYANGGASSCSGVVFQDKQHVLTNNHCVDGARSALVLFGNGLSANVVKVVKHGAEGEDLALVELAPHQLDVEPVEFKAEVAVGDRVMALPGCHVLMTGSEPLGGHAAGMVLRDGSIAVGKNSVSVGVNFRGIDGKSGSLVVNQRGEPVALDQGSAFAKIMKYRTQPLDKTYEYLEYSIIKGSLIKGLLSEVPPDQQVLAKWVNYAATTLAGKRSLFASGALNAESRRKILGDIKKVIDVRPDEYSLRHQWAIASFSEPTANLEEILCTLGEIDDVYYNPISSFILTMLVQGEPENEVKPETIASLEKIVSQYSQQEHLPALVYLLNHYTEQKDEANLGRVQGIVELAVQEFQRREESLNGN